MFKNLFFNIFCIIYRFCLIYFIFYYIPYKYKYISILLVWRLKNIIIVRSSFNSYEGNYSLPEILELLFLMLIDHIFNVNIHIFNSSLDVIGKYLLEYDFINPYKNLMMERIIGIICLYYFL